MTLYSFLLFPTDGALLCVSLQLFTCQIFTAFRASNYINTVRLYVTLSLHIQIEIEKEMEMEIVYCHQFLDPMTLSEKELH